MRKLSRFEKFGLMAAVIIAFTYFYVERVYEPQEARLKRTIANLNKVVEQINNLKEVPPAATVKRSLKAHRQELVEVTAQLAGARITSGAEREVTALLKDINDQIARNGLRVNSLVPGGRVTDDLQDWNLFQINLEGSFHRFLDFLRDLKDLKDAVKIEQVQLEKGDEGFLRIQLRLMI